MKVKCSKVSVVPVVIVTLSSSSIVIRTRYKNSNSGVNNKYVKTNVTYDFVLLSSRCQDPSSFFVSTTTVFPL